MKWLFALTPTLFFFACITSPDKMNRTKPRAERTNEDAPVPTRLMALRQPGSFNEIALGHSVYMRKCGECHVHKFPDEIKSAAWHIHVPGMAWNVGIEPHEEQALLRYLEAASNEFEAGR